MGKRLNTRVEVDGTWYGPDTGVVPDDVARKITNPKLWVDEDGSDGRGGGEEKYTARAGTRSGARLARYVEVGGVTYGPDDPVPDDIAEKITNPGAWVDRRLPMVTVQAVKAQVGERHGAAGPTPHPGIAVAEAAPATGAEGGPDAGAGDAGVGDGDPPPTEPATPAAAKKVVAPRKANGSGA